MRLSPLTKAWFDLPDDPDKSRFEILHLLSGDIAEIDDESNKEMVELVTAADGSLSTKAVVEIKKKIKQEKIVCKSVVGWENVLDSEGEQLECNEVNKLRVCREQSRESWISFFGFLSKSRKKLALKVNAEQEAAKGN